MRRLLPILLLLFSSPLAAQRVEVRDGMPPDHVVVQWVRYYSVILELEGWSITVGETDFPDSTGWIAGTNIQITKKTAQASFDLPLVFAEAEPWRVVVHELLHIKTAMPTGLILGLTEGDPEMETFGRDTMENLIVALAHLPIWPPPLR